MSNRATKSSSRELQQRAGITTTVGTTTVGTTAVGTTIAGATTIAGGVVTNDDCVRHSSDKRSQRDGRLV